MCARLAATVGGVAGQSGSATLARDGVYGAIAGKAVAVEPATGFTFDSPLVLRPRSSGTMKGIEAALSAPKSMIANLGETPWMLSSRSWPS